MNGLYFGEEQEVREIPDHAIRKDGENTHSLVSIVETQEIKQTTERDINIKQLWVGDVAGGNPFGKGISIILSHCHGDLGWVNGFLVGFEIRNITIVSKCGSPPSKEEMPAGAKLVEFPNVGRNDHTMAFVMAKLARKKSKDEIIVFLKDNVDIHQRSRPRTFYEMLSIASVSGFGCFQKPIRRFSQFHATDILTKLNMTQYDGVVKYREDGTKISNENNIFKSNYTNMGHWLKDLNITLPSPLAAVCYGGIYAVQVSQILSVPKATWKAIATSLSRGDNIEEGHFAERTWAALLTTPASETETKLIFEHAHHVHVKVMPDGGGALGALVGYN